MRSSTIHNSPFTIHSANAGFSIIEATLAVVVVAAGVISIFLLFSAGLDLGSPSVGDTTCAMFADSVLNGLRAESERAARQGRWLEFWEDLAYGSNITLAAHSMLADTTTVEAGPLRTNFVSYYPQHSTNTPVISAYALRYRLTVEWFNDAFPSNRTAVTLKVWPGERGGTSDDHALVFYTHFRGNNDP